MGFLWFLTLDCRKTERAWLGTPSASCTEAPGLQAPTQGCTVTLNSKLLPTPGLRHLPLLEQVCFPDPTPQVSLVSSPAIRREERCPLCDPAQGSYF